MATLSDIQNFYDRVEHFDWLYEMSDSHEVYLRGRSAWSLLAAEAHKDQTKQEILDAFSKHHYSGAPWNTEKQPKPMRPS